MTISAILAGFDARAWAGVNLFSRDGDVVAAPAVGTLHDGGHYPDALALLNGYSSVRSLSSMLDAQWSGAGAFLAGIDEDGFLYLESSSAVAFSVAPGSDDPWGWGGGVTAVAYGSATRATATRPWTRGPFSCTSNAKFQVTHGAAQTMPLYQMTAHSLPTWLSGPTTPDFDGVVECLEKWDNAACDNGTERFRWGIDAEGRTFSSWPTGLGATVGVSWSSTTFRAALGFDGTETAVLANGIYTLTSTYPALGVQPLRNRIVQLDPAGTNSGSALELENGRIAGRQHRYARDLDIRFNLRGGVGITDTSPHLDEVELYLRRVAPYLWRGARCTVVPDWSDPRMGRSLVAQFADGVATPVLQSPQVRGDAGAVMGRKRCEVSSDSADRVALSFAPNRPRVRSGDVSMTLRILPDA